MPNQTPNNSNDRETTFIETAISRWRTTAPTLATQLSNNTAVSSRNETQIREDIDSLITAAEQLSVSSWQPGESCVECGSTFLDRWVSYLEIARHSDGDRTFRDGDAAATVYAWSCSDCETVLAVSPAALLLPVAPGDPPSHIELDETETVESPLQEALLDKIPETAWRTGESCPFCKQSFIREAPLDVYPAESTGGTYSQAGHAPRLQTIAYTCDGCGEMLRGTRAHILGQQLSL